MQDRIKFHLIDAIFWLRRGRLERQIKEINNTARTDMMFHCCWPLRCMPPIWADIFLTWPTGIVAVFQMRFPISLLPHLIELIRGIKLPQYEEQGRLAIVNWDNRPRWHGYTMLLTRQLRPFVPGSGSWLFTISVFNLNVTFRVR